MDRSAIEARRLVERLWRDAAAAEELQRSGGVPDLPPADHIQHREDLAALNRGYLLAGPVEPPLPEGKGLRIALKRRVIRLAAEVVRTMLERYFADERELVMTLVRFQNELAKKEDRVEDEVRALAAATRDELRALRERVESLHRLVEARLAKLEGGAKG